MNENDGIVSVLLEEEILDKEQVETLVTQHKTTGKNILTLLKNSSLVTSDQLTRLVARTNNIEFINLSADDVDPMAARLVPFETARKKNLIPVRIERDRLYVAMSSPLDLPVRDSLAARTGYHIIPLAATEQAVRQAIAFHFTVEQATKQDIVSMRLKQGEKGTGDAKKVKTISGDSSQAPIVRLVDSIITGAIDAKASDIHIEPQQPDMRVRYRCDGMLIEALEIPASAQREVISHIKILAEMDISEKRLPQDGHIALHYSDREFDLRVSTLPAVGGEKVVIRILDAESGLQPMEKLVTDPEDYRRFSNMISNPYGMLLMTGPTGSGKTTTLYSIIQKLNTVCKNIVTVEDPVEYHLKGITQIQVKPEVGRTFAAGLKSILRQDPDIILVGEIRDEQTAEIAISAALTGHLVLSTLHTNDAAGAISRLISLGVPPFQVASALLGTVAQRLARTLCPHCKTRHTPDPQRLDRLNLTETIPPDTQLYEAVGCDSCRGTGYNTRQGLYEILSVTPEVRNLIMTGSSDQQIKQLAIEQGMKTLKMQALKLMHDHRTSLAELLRVIDTREE